MVQANKRYRAAIIGHSGRGDYGHGLDIAFTGLSMVDVIAVADPDEAGRRRAQERSGATATYADYHEMLRQERPDLVAIGPRILGERVEMVAAAAAAGANIFLEKPMAPSLAEADAMLDVCDTNGVKMAVAHQGRLHPATLYTLTLLERGEIGKLRLVRGYGKLDHRGGGLDTMVLGTHVIDLMRLFAGDAHWVSAELLAGSRLVMAEDVRPGAEEIGPIAGDGLRATMGFEDGVIGLFESFANMARDEQLFGLDLIGEEGQLSLRAGFTKRLFKYPHPYVIPGDPFDRWTPVPVPGAGHGEVPGEATSSSADLVQRANQRLVLDLISAAQEDREPLSSGRRARASLELIQAIAAAHVHGGRVTLPLQERTHPLEDWLN